MTSKSLILLVATAVMALSGMAGAQAVDKAAAEALFNEARRLSSQGNYAAACPKFAESQKLDPAPGTLLNLADCYEHVGKTASAWATWLEAAAAAKARGQTDREQLARDRAAALQPNLLHLTVTVPPGNRVEGLKITRNDVPIREVLWGTTIPVDPGSYSIVATAPGYKPWQTDVVVTEGAPEPNVTIPALEPEAAAAPVPEPAPAPAPPAPVGPSPPPTAVPPPASYPPPMQPAGLQPAAPAAPPADQADTGSGLRIAGILTTLAGVVGLGVGVYFMVDAISKNGDSKEYCRTNEYCTQEGVDLRDEAIASGNIATVGFVAGGVLLGTGFILLSAAPSSPAATAWAPSDQGAHVTTIRGARLLWRGTF